jgi:hypothetical protein
VVNGLTGSLTLRSDPAALSAQVGIFGIYTATWERIDSVLTQTQNGQPTSYRALGERSRLLASWGMEHWQPSQQPGSVPPDEFAAIVAQRSGAKVDIQEA